MALAHDVQDGQTPLDPDELAGLIPNHLTTQAELNDWEQTNILSAVKWLLKNQGKDVLNEAFCRSLHKKMFDQTWAWAGTFRCSDKNIGCDWTLVSVHLRNLFDDVRVWIQHGTYPPDEIAARFHHRLVSIHPFPNGNGRHSRMMADELLLRMQQPLFTWGNRGPLVAADETRGRYLIALRAADNRDYGPLLAFARSA